MDSLNGLDRLLEVEAKAAALIGGAETQAGTILRQAKEEALKKEKSSLVEIRKVLNAKVASVEADLNTRFQNELDMYKAMLEKTPTDPEAFLKTCSALIESGA